nr:calcium-binding protein [uncultured Gellertiella sp.]
MDITGSGDKDILNGTDLADRLYGGDNDDTLNGFGGNNVLYGGAGVDTLYAGKGNDWLDGGAGADHMYGGAGDDIYLVDDKSDVVDEATGVNSTDAGGFDTVVSGLGNYSIGQFIENLVLSGTGDSTGLGNDLDNTITGNSGNNVLGGAKGNDTLYGGAGKDELYGDSDNDMLYGGAGDDSLDGGSGSDTLYGGAGDDSLDGGSGSDTLYGGAGDDTLYGNAGNDKMYGGKGDDSYYVDSVKDVVDETDGKKHDAGGTDVVYASVNYTLGDFVENLHVTGDGLTGRGNALNNTIVAEGKQDTLYGGDGNDGLYGHGDTILYGGKGNDGYVVTDLGDKVDETDGKGLDLGGTDTVWAGITYTLGAFVERLVLTGVTDIDGTGNALDNTITGNGHANTLFGGAGNDWLDGGGAQPGQHDTLYGGKGNDTYVVHSVDDVVDETNGGMTDLGGIDTVRTDVYNYHLADHVENLVLTGAAAANLLAVGNALDNTITGDAGNNIIFGLLGNDTIYGGAGDDYLGGDTGKDVLYGGAGADQLRGGDGDDTLDGGADDDHVFGDAGMDLLYGGNGNDTLEGGFDNDTLYGGKGNDRLDGGAGDDTMAGGKGDDTYIVDSTKDVVDETDGKGHDAGGTDEVHTDTISYKLGAYVENLFLEGALNLNGTGNKLNNILNGNEGNNKLNGGDGDDTLLGGKGNDTLTGGSGKDYFVFNTALDPMSNVDHITDFKPGDDVIVLSNTIFTGMGIGSITKTADFVANDTGIATKASDHIIYNTKTGQLYYDHDGAGGDNAVLFAVLDTKVALHASDFYIF